MLLPWATSNVYGEGLVVMKDNTWLLGDNSNEIGIWGLIC